jgi:5'-deoxynucleotidase YfbR-like HD superfamily hydrolase
MERLEQQITFVRELDKLKRVQRQTWLTDTSRQENSAEHSWHIAVMAMVLAEYAPGEALDVGRVIQMLLLHDIVEIDAGDTFCYDRAAVAHQADQEERAAERLFGLLPPDLADRFRALWEEFEARETPESLAGQFAGPLAADPEQFPLRRQILAGQRHPARPGACPQPHRGRRGPGPLGLYRRFAAAGGG